MEGERDVLPLPLHWRSSRLRPLNACCRHCYLCLSQACKAYEDGVTTGCTTLDHSLALGEPVAHQSRWVLVPLKVPKHNPHSICKRHSITMGWPSVFTPKATLQPQTNLPGQSLTLGPRSDLTKCRAFLQSNNRSSWRSLRRSTNQAVAVQRGSHRFSTNPSTLRSRRVVLNHPQKPSQLGSQETNLLFHQTQLRLKFVNPQVHPLAEFVVGPRFGSRSSPNSLIDQSPGCHQSFQAGSKAKSKHNAKKQRGQVPTWCQRLRAKDLQRRWHHRL